MRQSIIFLLLIINGSVLFAQDAKSYIHQGNQLYEQKKFKEAEATYRKAIEKKNENLTGNFNLGDALYKQKKFDNAAKNFSSIVSANADPAVKARAYHNLGNTMLETKKYQESVDAYKKSLLNNPADDATRYNLAYAQTMLKKQQQQNQNQNKDNQNKQDKKEQDKKEQNKKDQNRKDQGKGDQNKDPNQQNNDQDKKDQENKSQPNGISKDDAQRMLDALNNQEQGTQDKLKNKKLKAAGEGHILKDW